ncbi:MAG: hypothetical protein IJX80_00065 [Clostridia bacterium]|nr:hypothetical protein [Clostridia bacterium]
MKKRIFGRCIAFLLCAVILVVCVSCASTGDETLPSGMQLATVAGADFRLYVPTHWSVNVAYGVSGGFYSLSEQSTVSMMKYAITEEMRSELPAPTEEDAMVEARAGWFYENELLPSVEAMTTDGVTTQGIDCIEVLLDGVNARQYHIKARIESAEMHFLYVVGERNDAFYVLSYAVTDNLYLMLVEDYVNILEQFRFAEPYAPEADLKDVNADAEAPEGMKLASNDDVSYRLYVPTDWKIDRTQEIFAAYVEADRSNVSVIPYMPSGDEAMNVMEYFEENKSMMLKTPGADFEMLNGEGVKVSIGGSPAMRYEYLYSIGGVQYRYLQIIAAYSGMFYNITYTALPQNYEMHIGDVDAILSAFAFR